MNFFEEKQMMDSSLNLRIPTKLRCPESAQLCQDLGSRETLKVFSTISLDTHWTHMFTWLCMPLSNIKMPRLLLSWLVITVLFHCRASSPAQYALTNHVVTPPTYAMTSHGLNVSRDYISLIIAQCLGLPPMYSHPTLPLSLHYALNLCYRAQKPIPFTLCSERARPPVRIAFSRTLILPLLCSSGDVDDNPGPSVS
jgi:hypothetical protein